MLNFELFPHALSDIFVVAIQSRTLSPSICQSLSIAASSDGLDEESKDIAKRLLWAVKKGRIQVIA